MARLSSVAAAVLLGTSCAYQGTPVPITGDTRLLEGEWEGTYSSEQTGRTGSILFSLKAGTDSAFGDVLMLPARPPEMRPPNPNSLSELPRPMVRGLRISFVRCEDGEVTGRLEPYEDPDTGERVYTTFEGRLRGDEFRGTFSTFYPGRGHVLAGTWSVQRRKE